MGSLTSVESIVELLRAFQVTAWVHLSTQGMDWAGDLISFNVRIQNMLKDQEIKLFVNIFARLDDDEEQEEPASVRKYNTGAQDEGEEDEASRHQKIVK